MFQAVVGRYLSHTMGESAEEPTEKTSARREELAAAAAELLVVRGLSDMSLRSIAAALGTSHRMLLYYFSSRDDLIADALDHARERYLSDLDLALSGGPEGVVPLAARLWEFLAEERSQLHVRLQLQAWSRSFADPDTYARMLSATGDLRPRIEVALKADGMEFASAGCWATLIQASLYGLMLDLQSGVDRSAVDASFATLVSMVDSVITHR